MKKGAQIVKPIILAVLGLLALKLAGVYRYFFHSMVSYPRYIEICDERDSKRARKGEASRRRWEAVRVGARGRSLASSGLKFQ